VEGAFSGTPGVAGMDEDKGGEVRVIEFERIKGGKPFDVTTGWFVDMMKEVNQH
jgi:pyrophosphate--fructose-6-phosphate 1-phosphotransferase